MKLSDQIVAALLEHPVTQDLLSGKPEQVVENLRACWASSVEAELDAAVQPPATPVAPVAPADVAPAADSEPPAAAPSEPAS
jgi:hypothetical protein